MVSFLKRSLLLAMAVVAVVALGACGDGGGSSKVVTADKVIEITFENNTGGALDISDMKFFARTATVASTGQVELTQVDLVPVAGSAAATLADGESFMFRVTVPANLDPSLLVVFFDTAATGTITPDVFTFATDGDALDVDIS